MFDDEAGGLMKAILIIMFLPFYLAWKLVKWLTIVLWEKHQDRGFARGAAEYDAMLTAAEEKYNKARAEQVGKLMYETLTVAPSTPATRMRATFHQGTITLPQRDFMFRDDKMRFSIRPQENTMYAVCVRMDFSEEERAILEQNQLRKVEFDRLPRNTRAEMTQLKEFLDLSKQQDAHRAVIAYQMQVHDLQPVDVMAFLAGTQTFIFESSHEAQQYVEKLKTQIMPQLKAMISQYANRKTSETVEF